MVVEELDELEPLLEPDVLDELFLDPLEPLVDPPEEPSLEPDELSLEPDFDPDDSDFDSPDLLDVDSPPESLAESLEPDDVRLSVR